jgi:choline-glycine betaine transporter
MRDSSNQLSRLLAHMQPTVFLGSAALVLGFVIFGTAWPQAAQSAFGAVQRGIITNFGWLYILGATGLLVFVLELLISPYRHIRLGGDQTEPDFGNRAWFAMLFSAGMGTGLVFGPTVFQIKLLISSTGAYLEELIDTSLWLELRPDTNPDSRWQAVWTLFYWSWWVIWSPRGCR